MARLGQIVVECESLGCHATVTYGANAIESELAAFLREDGWTRKDGKDICPQCVEEGKS